MKYIAIIPARYASSRFPGKPLADMKGKPMIQRVYEQVNRSISDVWVATDDARIESAVKGFGGKVVMTSPNHKSGTDRICEAYEKIGLDFDVIVNVQGDEPFIYEEQLETIKGCFSDSKVQIATLVKPFRINDGFDKLENPNSPKVIIDDNDFAIYFSRSVIPYLRDVQKEDWLSKHTFYKHLGLYAYQADVLKAITKLPQTSLEKAESLEQLRWIQNGYKIKVGYTDKETIGIDTPQDLVLALKVLDK